MHKWIGISHGRTRDYGADNCMLCREYYYCEDCPIGIVSGGCDSSPYVNWVDLIFLRNGASIAECNEEKVAALHEALFVYGAIECVLGWDVATEWQEWLCK